MGAEDGLDNGRREKETNMWLIKAAKLSTYTTLH
jgi:hypothetical protein